jgi:hypothetical protein
MTSTNVAQLWNLRAGHRMRRHWVSFSERMIIAGGNLEQSGVLSVPPIGHEGLKARLRVLGKDSEELVAPGHDITVWIHGLELVIVVRAVEDDRMLVEFGVPPGSKVGVTLESGREAETALHA